MWKGCEKWPVAIQKSPSTSYFMILPRYSAEVFIRFYLHQGRKPEKMMSGAMSMKES